MARIDALSGSEGLTGSLTQTTRNAKAGFEKIKRVLFNPDGTVAYHGVPNTQGLIFGGADRSVTGAVTPLNR